MTLPVRKDPFWPAAVITLGLSLTAGWVILLGYGLVRLEESRSRRCKSLLQFQS